MKSLLTSFSDINFNSSGSNLLVEHSQLTFCVYLPQRNSKGEIINPKKTEYWINLFTKTFISFFDGCSINKVEGAYLNSSELLIKEKTTIISASLFKINYSKEIVISELLNLLITFGINTNQESLLFSINNIEKKIILKKSPVVHHW